MNRDLKNRVVLALAVMQKIGVNVTISDEALALTEEPCQEIMSNHPYREIESWQSKKKTPWRKRK